MEITHLAFNLKSPEETEAAKDHFERVYGLHYLGTRDRRGLLTMDMTDGHIAIALTHYRADAPEKEATAAGPAPSYHHIGFDVDDFERYSDDALKAGYELFSAPGQIPLKYRAPGDTVVEFAPSPFFAKRAIKSTPMPIKHIALRLTSREQVKEANAYYQDTWGFKSMGSRDRNGQFTHDLSDGRIAFAATVFERDDDYVLKSSTLYKAPCIHHIGFEVDDIEAYTATIKELDCEILSPPGKTPVKYVIPGGVMAEFAPKPYFSERV